MPRRSSLVSLVAALMQTSLAMAQSPVPIGEYVYETHETEHPYAASRYVGPSSSSFTIHFPDATYIAPHFERFQIAEGGASVARPSSGAIRKLAFLRQRLPIPDVVLAQGRGHPEVSSHRADAGGGEPTGRFTVWLP